LSELNIELESPARQETIDLIDQGLDAYNLAFGMATFEEFTLPLKASDGAIKGGIFARANSGMMFIKTIWIEESLRRKGYGRTLMAAAEAEGRRRGCKTVWLDTYSFQARPFYEKLGFTVFGTLDYPAGFKRFFMQKGL
jgi:GNAT superfamily N-acetyltransferase